MAAEPLGSVREVIAVVAAAGMHGEELLRRVGLDPSVLADFDARVAHSVIVRLWEEAPRLTGDPAFGLHLAESIPIGVFDVLDFAATSSRNLGEALACCIRFQRIVHEAEGLRLKVAGGEASLSLALPKALGEPPAQVQDFILAYVLTYARQATGVAWTPRAVSFAHPTPAETTEYTRVFRAPLAFDQPMAVLSFDATLLELPLLEANPALHAVVVRYAEEILARRPPGPTVGEQVFRVVVEDLRGRPPRAENTARRLGLSRRTLHRRLSAEGTTFEALVDQARKDVALRLLSSGRRAAEIAFLLGFADQSSFYRAFRRWTGTTPASWVAS